jgi:hypothetical protein
MILTAGIESAVGKSIFNGVCGGDGGCGDGAPCEASTAPGCAPTFSFQVAANWVTRAS